MNGSLAGELISGEMSRFAKILNSYKECSPEIRAIVDEMSKIVADPDSSTDDREHACDTMIEALLPGLTADIAGGYWRFMTSDEAIAADSELDAEEAAFADRVRSAMTDRGITQEQIAERTGVSQPAISNILNRRCRPQRKTVDKIAEALGMNPNELWAAP